MARIFFIAFLFFLQPFYGLAQSQNKFQVQQFNTENGLPSNGIKGLQWDENTGFLWVATEAGIVRFNGQEFKTYSNKDEPHITNERILFLVRNNQGDIYTADNTGNIFRVNKNKLSFQESKYITGNTKSSIIYLSVSEKLYKSISDFDKAATFPVQFSELLPVNDSSGFISYAGNLYFFSNKLKSPVRVVIDIQPANSFKCGNEIFFTDSLSNIYLFDKESYHLTKTDIYFENTADGADKENFLFTWENGMQSPVLFAGNKAWKIDYENGRLQAVLITDQVPQDVLIRYVQYDDKQKLLIIGTDSKGIIIIDQDLVETVRYEKAGINQRTSYYSQVELKNGNILTNAGHILGNNIPDKNKLPVTGNFSANIFLMGDSLLWFTQTNANLKYSCLHSYNYTTGITKTYGKIKEDYQLVMATSGRQLYLAKESGIYRLVNDTLDLLYAYPPDKRSRLHYDMKEIEPGVLGIATCNSLLRFNIQSRKLDTIFSSGNYCVRTIWKYKRYIFFGTYGGGLFIYSNGIVTPLPLDKNKYLLFTHCFIEDGNGYCWISTNRGLFKASLDELTNVTEKNSATVYYYYLGKNDGMNMTELNGGCNPCALRMKNHTISFPTMDGLLWVDPEKATPVLPEGEIYIDEILVDNKSYNPDSIQLKELPAKSGEIIIRLAISEWSNKENIYIDYKLNNSPAWIPVNTEKEIEIRFNHLPPGSYTLRIRKHNGFGADNYSYKDLTFYIKIAWYQQWWFTILIVLAAAGIFALYYNIRTRQFKLNQQKLEKQVAEKTKELQEKNEVLEKNDTIKTRLISIISHDIVTPLKFVTVAGKNLIEKRKLMSEELQQETINEMIQTTQELQLLSTNILNWIKYQNENRRLAMENVNLYELVGQVTGILKSLANSKKIVLENKVNPGLILYQYYEPLKILIYNLLTNAINFSEQSSIIIGADKTKDGLKVWVQDYGVGMTPEQVQRITADEIIITSANIDNRRGNGLGYLIIKDLVKMMGATLHIESEKGKGTIVSVFIPFESNGK